MDNFEINNNSPPKYIMPSSNNNIKRTSYLGFTSPLTLNWFISVVGSEYCQTYLWIAKDLSWMQGLRRPSIFFGLLALIWSMLLLYHGIRTENWHEIWYIYLYLIIFNGKFNNNVIKLILF